MIIKWTVSPWSNPARQEYCKETEHFYMHARGRGRDAKVTTYLRYFDSEAEALEYIRQREENKLEQKRIDRIKSAGVELLEALEGLIDNEKQSSFEHWLSINRPSGDCDSVHSQWLESSGYDDFLDLYSDEISAIAKARGEA